MTLTGVLALITSACLQIESTITLKKDGSGTVTETLVFGQQMAAMMQMAEAQGGAAGAGGNPMAKMMDKGAAKARAKEMGEGVEFVSMEKINDNGRVGVKTTFKFSDINKLNYTSSSAMSGMGDMKGMGVKDNEDAAPAFKYAGGKLTITQKKPDVKEGDLDAAKKAAEEVDAQMGEQELAMMQGMMKDMRMTMKIKIEPGIKKTNASHVNGDTLTMADIQFAKLLSDPKKLQALQSGDFEKTKKALKGMDGIKFETQEVVEVELK